MLQIASTFSPRSIKCSGIFLWCSCADEMSFETSCWIFKTLCSWMDSMASFNSVTLCSKHQKNQQHNLKLIVEHFSAIQASGALYSKKVICKWWTTGKHADIDESPIFLQPVSHLSCIAIHHTTSSIHTHRLMDGFFWCLSVCCGTLPSPGSLFSLEADSCWLQSHSLYCTMHCLNTPPYPHLKLHANALKTFGNCCCNLWNEPMHKVDSLFEPIPDTAGFWPYTTSVQQKVEVNLRIFSVSDLQRQPNDLEFLSPQEPQ